MFRKLILLMSVFATLSGSALAAGATAGMGRGPTMGHSAATPSMSPRSGMQMPAGSPATGMPGNMGSGSMGTPGSGSMSNPGSGNMGTPGSGNMGTPGSGSMGTPGSGNMGTPGSMGTPGTGSMPNGMHTPNGQ